MSADDDTFEIDIYGDDQPEAEPEPAKDEPSNGDQTTAVKAEANAPSATPDVKQEAPQIPAPKQGTKRKAEDDEPETIKHEQYDENWVDNRPIDPNAMPSLKLAELHWWTTEEDLRAFCAKAGAEEELQDLSFGEHKINGKSKGEAYLEFTSLQASTAVKHEIEQASQMKNESGARTAPFTVYFASVGNPFRTAAGAGNKKDNFGSQGNRGGAYNNFGGNRGGGGNYGGRGGGYNNRGGGGGYNNGMRGGMQNQQQSGGWGNMNGMGGGGFGGGFNPMMGMGMGGYGNMARGGMMGNMGGMGMMGGRGGMMNGIGMGSMGGMGMNMMGGGGRGGGMMGGRGNWGAGGGGYGGGGMQGDQNKRAKMG